MPRAAPRNQAELKQAAAALSAAASSSPKLATAVDDLCQEALLVMGVMLETGSPDDRIAVFKALAPLIREMNLSGEDGVGGIDAATKAQMILMGNWDWMRDEKDDAGELDDLP